MSAGSGQDLIVGLCDNSDELFSLLTTGKFVDDMNNYKNSPCN
jgi:hypothetical protein